ELWVRDRPEPVFEEGDRAERADEPPRLLGLAHVADRRDEDRRAGLAVVRQDEKRRQGVWERLEEVAEDAYDRAGMLGRVRDKPAPQRRKRMQAVRERGDHAEVAASSPQSPKELGIAVTRAHLPAVRGNHLGGDEVVAGQAVRPEQVADPAAQRQATDARRAERAAGRGQAMRDR